MESIVDWENSSDSTEPVAKRQCGDSARTQKDFAPIDSFEGMSEPCIEHCGSAASGPNATTTAYSNESSSKEAKASSAVRVKHPSTPTNDTELVQFSARLTARIRHAERTVPNPLFHDPYARLFCNEDAVASKFDHTHFLFRKMFHRYTAAGGSDPNVFKALYDAQASQLQQSRAKRPYIPVRTRLVDDICTWWTQSLRDNKNFAKTESKDAAVAIPETVQGQVVIVGSGTLENRSLMLCSCSFFQQ